MPSALAWAQMQWGRAISGRDVHAMARQLGADVVDPDVVEAWIAADAVFDDLAELQRARPPERIGLTPGAYAALFAPLFGEFE